MRLIADAASMQDLLVRRRHDRSLAGDFSRDKSIYLVKCTDFDEIALVFDLVNAHCERSPIKFFVVDSYKAIFSIIQTLVDTLDIGSEICALVADTRANLKKHTSQ